MSDSKSVFVTLILAISFSSVVFADAKIEKLVQEKYDAEEAMWRYSGLGFINLDNMFEPKYCGREQRFYLGCLAGLDQFVKLANPKNKIAVTERDLTVEESLDPIPEDIKSYYAIERIRFKEFEKTYNSHNVDRIKSTYLKYKVMIKTIEPYQVARAVNATENTIYDIHSSFFPRSRYNAVRLSEKEAIVGFSYGRINKDVTIVNVVKDMPAERGGVKAGDVILSFDDKDASKMSTDEIYQATDKKLNESINLKLKRDSQIFSVRLKFIAPQLPKPIERPLTIGQKKISYIQFSSFENEGVCQVVRKALDNAEKKSHAVIIDLRNNSGGRTAEAACILGALIGPGKPLIYEKDLYSDSILSNEKTTGQQVFFKPVVVIINHATASASEILAGDLQVYGRGLVVGTTSYGKGSEQIVREIDRLVRRHTSYIYHLADGQSPQLVGIEPDIFTYVNPRPMDLENNVFREGDVGLKPLQATAINVPPINSKRISVPKGCMKEKNVEGLYSRMGNNDWRKDLQLLNSMVALSCL